MIIDACDYTRLKKLALAVLNVVERLWVGSEPSMVEAARGAPNFTTDLQSACWRCHRDHPTAAKADGSKWGRLIPLLI